MTHDAQAAAFLALHRERSPLLLPNPWDIGTAKILVSLGFEALATTSSGFAATLGRTDGSVTPTRRSLTALRSPPEPVCPCGADLENGFADEPDGVAETVRRAVEAGLAGCSIEDYSPAGLFDLGLARSASPPRPKLHTEGHARSCSRPGPRTTYVATPTSTTPSPGSRRSRRQAPTFLSDRRRRAGCHRVDHRRGRPPDQRDRSTGPTVDQRATRARCEPRVDRRIVRVEVWRCADARPSGNRTPRAGNVRLLRTCGAGGQTARPAVPGLTRAIGRP